MFTSLIINNSDLQLDLGAGIDGLFADDRVLTSRVWNGTINYTVDSASVPFEFSPSLGLLLVGGLFGSSHLYPKHKAGKVVINSKA